MLEFAESVIPPILKAFFPPIFQQYLLVLFSLKICMLHLRTMNDMACKLGRSCDEWMGIKIVNLS